MEIYDNIEQGGPEWHELRRGLPTASMFGVLMVDNEKRAGREIYLYKLAGERLTGMLREEYTNPAMELGKRDEPDLLHLYKFLADTPVRKVAFVRNGKCGCSPDGLIGEDGVLEIKRTAPHLLIPMLLEPKKFPKKHYAQCQGALMVTGRKWCDLLVGHPMMPRPLIIRAERDDAYIQRLRDEIDIFDLELRRLVEKLK